MSETQPSRFTFHVSRPTVRLRDVTEADLPRFFAQEQDPEGYRMAAFAPREQAAFITHWHGVLANPANRAQTILCDEQVAGNIGSWTHDGEHEVGYWLDRRFWGRGVATAALQLLLDQDPIRPIYAYVAKHNIGSRRVLEKCGFRVCGEVKDFAVIDGEQIEGVILILPEEI